MKCVKTMLFKSGKVVTSVLRCSDKKAEELVKSDAWHYASKSAWKKHGRKYL